MIRSTLNVNDPADQRLMVIAPHPDDETLATGVMLRRAAAAGAAVRVVFVTDGDNNPWVQRIGERRWRIRAADRARYGRRRCEEAAAAMTRLGVPADAARFLGFRDQRVTDALTADGSTLIDRIADQLVDFAPTLLLSPSSLDHHPDHSAVAVAVHAAMQRLDPSARLDIRLLNYRVHGRTPLPRSIRSLDIRPTDDERAAKYDAVTCHASQQVCHPFAFAAMARNTECYIVDDDLAGQAIHPVRSAVRAGSQIWLDILAPARHAIFGPLRLHLLSRDERGRWAHHQIDLNWRRDRSPIRLADSGEIVGEAMLDRRHRGGFVRVPAGLFAADAVLFAKLRPRRGMFDFSGWRSLALTTAEPADHDGVCVVIPCYNAAEHCGSVVREAAQFADAVIAVDDGSTDHTPEVLADAVTASAGRIRRVTLDRNQGKGAALIAGFRTALATTSCSAIIMLDADGQHRPQDIPRLVAAHHDGAEFTIGQRRPAARIPLRSRIGNGVTRWIMRTALPGCPADTQSGFRGFDRPLLQQLVDQLTPGRYETEIEMLVLLVRGRCRITRVDIPNIYLEGNRGSHFRPLTDSAIIYARLFTALLRARRRTPDVDREPSTISAQPPT